jgi:hypothetical protein
MNLVLVAAGLALMVLPGWTTRLGARLAPQDWAHLTTASLWTGLVAVRIGLLVTAAPSVLRLAGNHGLAEACHQTLGPITPGGTATGLASAAGLVLLQARILRTRRHSRAARARLRVEPWLGHHEHHDDYDIVVLPTPSPIAYALEGQPPQVVLSDGLTHALSDDELAAVIHHERCHLHHGHQRWLDLALATDTALGWFRPVRRSAATLRLAIERWADETAAHQGNRAAVRTALTKVVDTMVAPVPAFTTIETIAARLDALDAGPPAAPARWRLAATAPAVALGVTIAAALLTGTGPIHHGVLGLVGYCPL